MPIIDADTHIDETEATWEYLREFEQEFKPITQNPSRADPSKTPSRYWLSTDIARCVLSAMTTTRARQSRLASCWTSSAPACHG